MYNKIRIDMLDNTLHIKQQWELELNAIIEDDSLENTCSRCHRLEANQNWLEGQNQVLQDNNFSSKNNPSNKYWRNCGMVGDHTHIFKYKYFGKRPKKNWKKSWQRTFPWTLCYFYKMYFLTTCLTQNNVIYYMFCWWLQEKWLLQLDET